MHTLISPYGDALVALMADDKINATLCQQAKGWPVIKLDALMQSDLELLLSGAYSPLTGYLGQADYLNVLNNMRLSDGRVWPLPLTLVIPIRLAQSLKLGQKIALSSVNGEIIAVVTVAEIYRANIELEAQQLGATLEYAAEAKWYVGGPVTGLAIPERYDFGELLLQPAEMRDFFQRRGWSQVVAYQSAQPLHRAVHEFISGVAAQNRAGLLIQPMVGGYMSERHEFYPLIRSYLAAMSRLSKLTSMLSLSPNYSRRGGVREILHRAIMMRNYGCSHLVVGGEPGGEGRSRRGADVLDSQIYQQISQHIHEIGVGLIPFPRMVYVEKRAQFMPMEEAPKDSLKLTLSAEEVKRRLHAGLEIPEWYAFPEVMAEIRQAYLPRHMSGFAILLTGMVGVGKTTLAHALSQVLMANGTRKVTVLDHELIARHPAIVGGYNNLGWIAAEMVRHQGIVVCAVPSPSSAIRRAMRQTVQAQGGYLELYLTASPSLRHARSAVTVEDSAYEVPEQPDLVINSDDGSLAQSLQTVILKLQQEGYLQ